MFSSYTVRPLDRALAHAYCREHHYLHTAPRAPSACYGLWHDAHLLGVCLYSVGSSEAARALPFGRPHAGQVLELSRFHLLDATARNAESWFLSRAHKALSRARPDLWGVLAFADPTAGHRGTIYQAVGALYLGRTRARRAYRDATGAIHSERQGRRTLNRAEAEAQGWTTVAQLPKYRYLLLCGGPLQRHYLRQALRVPVQPYPKPPPVQLALPLRWDRAIRAGTALLAMLDARYLGSRLARRYARRLGRTPERPAAPAVGAESDNPPPKHRPPRALAVVPSAAGAPPAR